jgi:5-methylcytosine-specific restriction endonuclease McrA
VKKANKSNPDRLSPPRGAKKRLREYLVRNVGKVLESKTLQEVAGGAVQYDRRLRELREAEGWLIYSHNDDANLKPGQYVLQELPPDKPIRFERGISKKLRAAVLDRNGFTCQMCGLTPGDIDLASGRKVRLHIGHIKDKSLGGKEELSNLRTLCSTCNQGAKNVTGEKPGTIWLLSQIRRAGQDEQRAVLLWLKKKFE